MKGGFLCAALLAGALAVAFPERAEACTRVVYMGPDGTVLTARSMDWKEDSRSNLWIFPRGMERSGEVGGNPHDVDLPVRQRGDFGIRYMQYRRHE